MDGMSNLDETTLQQFSDIFKHFQTGKPEQDDEVSLLDKQKDNYTKLYRRSFLFKIVMRNTKMIELKATLTTKKKNQINLCQRRR
jgi:uncharacterized protein YdgA (DUF945 family)